MPELLDDKAAAGSKEAPGDKAAAEREAVRLQGALDYWMKSNGSKDVLAAIADLPDTQTVTLTFTPKDNHDMPEIFPKKETQMTVAEVKEHMEALAKGDHSRAAGYVSGRYELTV